MVTRLQLRYDVPSRTREGHVHREGTEVAFVEPNGDDWWFVEVRVPDESLVGGAWFETLEVPKGDLDGIPPGWKP